MQSQQVCAKTCTVLFENEKEGKFLPLLMNYVKHSNFKDRQQLHYVIFETVVLIFRHQNTSFTSKKICDRNYRLGFMM